jgi:HK97 family phage major capsid protein
MPTSAEQLFDLFDTHISPNLKWVMGRDTYERVSRLVDGCGNPIVRRWNCAYPEKLLGYSIEVLDDGGVYLAFAVYDKTYEFTGGIDEAIMRVKG